MKAPQMLGRVWKHEQNEYFLGDKRHTFSDNCRHSLGIFAPRSGIALEELHWASARCAYAFLVLANRYGRHEKLRPRRETAWMGIAYDVRFHAASSPSRESLLCAHPFFRDRPSSLVASGSSDRLLGKDLQRRHCIRVGCYSYIQPVCRSYRSSINAPGNRRNLLI